VPARYFCVSNVFSSVNICEPVNVGLISFLLLVSEPSVTTANKTKEFSGSSLQDTCKFSLSYFYDIKPNEEFFSTHEFGYSSYLPDLLSLRLVGAVSLRLVGAVSLRLVGAVGARIRRST